MGRRIVLATAGSLGDLHPFLALGSALRERGHEVVIASTEFYRGRAQAHGLGFRPVRPAGSPEDPALVRRVMDPRRGPEFVLREQVFGHLRKSFDDLQPILERADLLLTSELAYAARIAAEWRGLPWVGTVLAPMSFFSVHDPSVLGPLWPHALAPRLGPTANRWLLTLARRMTRPWSEPAYRLRAELGLPPGHEPIFEGRYSPWLTLALFSPLLGRPQPDWPPKAVQSGFIFYDCDAANGLSNELMAFLEAGPPPIVFTLGSAAVYAAGDFFQQSLAALRRLGRRAVLIVANPRDLANVPLPDGVAVFGYAPYSALFRRAAAIVHQGGIGTLAQALRAGRPMLVVPHGFDQFDNAARIARLGVGRALGRQRYRAARVADELARLLDDPRYAARSAEAGRRVRAEDGLAAACAALEPLL